MKNEMLRMEHICKASTIGVDVLYNVNLNLYKGEILGLLGLDGSGKITLVKILMGLYPKDKGIIYLDEKVVSINSRDDSRKLGIFCIHQNLKLIPNLTVAENIFAIRNSRPRRITFNRRAVYQQAQRLLDALGLDMPPDMAAGELSTGQQHLVEIAKAVSENAKLIIMDDVADSYTPRDFEKLKQVLCDLRDQGMSVIYGNRKLDDMLDIADRITVLREGTTVQTLYRGEYTKEKLVDLLVGHEFADSFIKSTPIIGEEILQVDHLYTDGMLKDINFNLRRGEVLGLMDIENAISTELVEVLVGARAIRSGSVWINGKRVRFKNLRDAMNHGIGLIPENGVDSVFPNMSISDNLAFLIYKKISNAVCCVNSRLQRFAVKEYINALDIANLDGNVLAESLDKDSRLKVLMYRWLMMKPVVLIMVRPSTRLDLVSRKTLYSLVDNASREGVAIILVSSDLYEVWALCDRTIVIRDGKIGGEYSKDDIQRLDVYDLY